MQLPFTSPYTLEIISGNTTGRNHIWCFPCICSYYIVLEHLHHSGLSFYQIEIWKNFVYKHRPYIFETKMHFFYTHPFHLSRSRLPLKQKKWWFRKVVIEITLGAIQRPDRYASSIAKQACLEQSCIILTCIYNLHKSSFVLKWSRQTTGCEYE